MKRNSKKAYLVVFRAGKTEDIVAQKKEEKSPEKIEKKC